MYQVSCTNKDEFQPVFILIDGYWLEFAPEDYIITLE